MCFWWKLVKTWGSFIVCHGFTNATLRYVGVICLVFHVLQLTPIRFTKTKLVLHEQIYDETYAIKISHWKSNFPWFSYGYRKCMFVVLKLETKVLPIVFTVECRVVINIWRHSPIFLKHVSLWCLLSDPHRTIHKLVIGVWLSKKKPLKTHLPYPVVCLAGVEWYGLQQQQQQVIGPKTSSHYLGLGGLWLAMEWWIGLRLLIVSLRVRPLLNMTC